MTVTAIVALVDLGRGHVIDDGGKSTPWLLYGVIVVSALVIVGAIPLLIKRQAHGSVRARPAPAAKPRVEGTGEKVRVFGTTVDPYERYQPDFAQSSPLAASRRSDPRDGTGPAVAAGTVSIAAAMGLAFVAAGPGTYLLAGAEDTAAWIALGFAGLITVLMPGIPVSYLRQLQACWTRSPPSRAPLLGLGLGLGLPGTGGLGLGLGLASSVCVQGGVSGPVHAPYAHTQAQDSHSDSHSHVVGCPTMRPPTLPLHRPTASPARRHTCPLTRVQWWRKVKRLPAAEAEARPVDARQRKKQWAHGARCRGPTALLTSGGRSRSRPDAPRRAVSARCSAACSAWLSAASSDAGSGLRKLPRPGLPPEPSLFMRFGNAAPPYSSGIGWP